MHGAYHLMHTGTMDSWPVICTIEVFGGIDKQVEVFWLISHAHVIITEKGVSIQWTCSSH